MDKQTEAEINPLDQNLGQHLVEVDRQKK